MTTLERDFTDAAWHQCRQAKRAGYPDERYSQVLQDRGAPQTAKDLVGGRIQGMFARLCPDGRFELTLEWLMLQLQFQPIFTPPELKEARSRLVRGGCCEQLPICGPVDDH